MPNLKEILKEFVATANAGEYKTEGELLSAFPELSGYNSNTLKEFVSTANAGQYANEDELLSAFPEFGQEVKKKEESVPLWLQKQEQAKPKQEQTLPFLESKPSGISLGSQRVPETAPMFEAPPMRTPEEAQAIVEAPEDNSYLDNLYTNLGLGASMFNEAVFSLPETVINLFAVPQNFIAEKTGWNVGTNADKIKETLGITNPLLDWVNEDQKVLSGEVSNYIAKNYDDAGIASNFQSGNYRDGFELLGSSITQAVPISVALLLGGMVASTEALAATSTLGLTEGQRQELEEMDPTMSESEKTLKALSMSAAESVFSSIGQGTIGKVYRDIAKREGKEAAKGIFKDGLVQTYKTALEKGGMAAGFAGEGIEEAATQITQNVISGRSAFENVADAFATGAGSGVVFTAPISAINAKNYIKNKAETYATKDKIGEVLKDKADNIGNLYNVPVGTEITPDQLEIANLNKSRVLLENNLKKNVKDGKITPDDAKQSLYVFDKIQQVSNSVKDLNVDKEDKAKIATLLSKRNELANKIKNQDDVLVVQEKQQVEQINKQIEEIILKPKEDAIQEPSTEESVLRPEESQVGLQEVGEGNTQVQAPTEEVIKEEVKTGSIVKWDVFGNEDQGDWTIEKQTTTRGGVPAVELSKIYVEDSTDGKSYTKEYADKNGIKYDNERTITYVVPLSELSNLQQAPTEEVVQEEVVTADEELQAVFDRIEIPEDTEVLPGVDDELKTINESIGRVKEPKNREKDDNILQDLDDKIARAKRRIATADDADVAIEEFKQAQKEKTDFEETINKKKNFSQVDGLISDEIYFRDRDKGQYEYQELFDQDPRLAALQSAKDMVEFAKKNPDENINIENRNNDIKILEEDIAKFPVKQAVSPATPVVAPIGEVSIESAFDEDGEIDYDAEEAVKEIARARNLGITRDRELATVAKDEDGNIIGGAFTSYDNETGEYTFDVVVSEGAEGSGVGSKLLNSVIEIPSEIKEFNPKAKVKVDVVNPQMQAMLEKRGFEVTAKTGTDRVTMEKAKPKKQVSSKTPKAKSVPIPVAIPKPAAPAPKPAPKPVAVDKVGVLNFLSSKSLTIKIGEDLYKISYQKDEVGNTDKKVWFAKVTNKNGEEQNGRLCFSDEYQSVIYGLSLKEVEEEINYYYEKNELHLITQDDSGRSKEVIRVESPKPAPKPAPQPVAVVSQPAPRIQGPEALRQEYTNKINDVRVNKDKSRTPKQIEERIVELRAEYKKLDAEMTAPRPKAEPEAKAKPAPKKAAPAPKVEAKVEPVVSKKDQEEIKKLENEIDYEQGQIEDAIEEIGNTKYNLKEALAEIKKKRDALKGKKMSADERAEAKEDLDAEIEQAKDEHDAYLEQYNDQLSEAKKEKKKAETKLAKLQAKQVEAKAEPTSVVEEDEPSYDDIKDLDPTDETNLKKMLRKFDSMDNGLGEFGRGNLSSGMAIPLARAILKSIKVLLRAGIKIEDAIKRLATQNNLEEKDIVNMIKDVDKAQSAMKKLKDQIKAEARSATNAKNDMNQKRKNLSKVISEIEASGKISAFKAQAVINKIGKLNLDSKVAVDKFIDYAGKIFADAEYANKLNTAKDTRSQIRKLSKSKENFANLRDLGSKFAAIDPSMVEDIDEYNEMATLIRDSIKGSTTRKADVKFANMIKESDAMAYINKAMEAQQKMLLSQKQAEVQELLDIDASDLTYDQLMELVDGDKPLTKDNEKLIRAAINKAFRVYSSMIDASMRNSQDVFTDEDVTYTTNQKKVVKEFMSMDLNVLSPKQALESVDALVNFLQNQSIAKMESVLAKYKGETEMRAIEKKGIKSKQIKKYGSKRLGKALVEQTANIEIVFEREFGGFTRGGMVIDAMGVTSLINGKSRAQSESNNIVNKYVDKFYKLKPNGEVFNTALNNIERGMVAFMSRNVFGTDSEMKVEFKRRRDLIEESTTELEKGNEQEVAKAKVYQEVYDKILKDSDSIEQVQGKAAPENLEAVKFWQDEWADKYDQLYDTALGVYNKILEKDMNYSMPDRLSKLSSDTGKVDITTEDMGFLINNGTAPLYKKETGVLMASTRPESLPKNKSTSKVNRYVDLSFDNVNSNSMYDALVDINTAAPIRQVQSALNSDSFARIMKGTEDKELIVNRVDLLVRNIRNKNPFSNDEFSKAVKSLNRLASIGVGQALGGVLAPVKQVAGVATNTFINAGGRLDVQSTFDTAKQKFMNKSGYAIANRGVESQAQIESLNKMIEKAVKSKPEQAIKQIEDINNWWLKTFLVDSDVAIARASWMTYYEKSLKDQGINTESIDYNTHEINEKAGNYAQRQVNRQQNISDPDLAGALLSDKNATKQLVVKVLMPFASFRMNQSARLGSDLATIMDKTATKEDKEIATRSLGGFAVEMAVFRMVSAGSALLIAAVVKNVMGRDDDEEKEKKKNDAIVKGQLTSTVADVFSPAPLLDKGIQLGVSAVLDATQDALDVSDEDRLEIYSGNKQDFMQSLGLLGISGARALQLYEMSVLAAGGSYEDNYGRKKYLSEKDKEAIATLIPIAVLSNIGLAPSEVNSIVRSSLADAKRSGTTVESEESKRKSEQSKIMGLNKEDLKRYYPDIYEQNYGEGTPDAEKRRLEREENQLERQMKDEDYNYQPKDGARKQGRDSRARGAARDPMRRSGR
jgi:ribosomal protein S18 acetylase RimI-like enzyme